MSEIVLSNRARNVLSNAGYDMRDVVAVRSAVFALLNTTSNPRWRNCGYKTLRELREWSGQALSYKANDHLTELGAISFLTQRGFSVIAPKGGDTCAS